MSRTPAADDHGRTGSARTGRAGGPHGGPAPGTRPVSAVQRRRFEAILGWLDEFGRVEVADIAERLGVSIETTRRDLSRLEQDGRLRRAHGGAIPVGVPALAAAIRDLPMPDEEVPEDGADQPSGHVAHAALAAAALGLLGERDRSVLLDSGPAAEALAAVFPGDRQRLVATASVAAAAALSRHADLAVHNLGGQVVPGGTAQTGDWTRQELARLHVDVAFVAPVGVSARLGLTADSAEDAAVQAAMVAAADRVVVLAPASAADRAGFVRFAEAAEADAVVVEHAAPQAFCAALREAGPAVHRAGAPPGRHPAGDGTAGATGTADAAG